MMARKFKNFAERRKSLWCKGFIAFLGHADLSVSISEYRGFADGRDTPDTGHDGSRFGRPLDGRNAPIADISVPCARRQRSERKRVHSISKEKGGPKPPKHKVSRGIPARAFISYRT